LYQGLFRVLRRGPKVFYVQIGGSEEAVSVDRLKPHLGGGEVLPAVLLSGAVLVKQRPLHLLFQSLLQQISPQTRLPGAPVAARNPGVEWSKNAPIIKCI
jgi:hypothetical protein